MASTSAMTERRGGALFPTPLTQSVNCTCTCLLCNEALQDWEMPSEASNRDCLAYSCNINLNYSSLKTGIGLAVLKGHEILSKDHAL